MIDYRLFAIPRSGSTLTYNILKEITQAIGLKSPNPAVHHGLKFNNQKYLCCIRDFRDCVVSHWRVNYGKFNEEEKEIKTSFSELIDSIRDVKKSLCELDLLFSQFENKFLFLIRFKNLTENPFDTIKLVLEFLNIEAENELISKVLEKNSLQNNKIFCEQFKTFKEYDRETHWHGLHIYKAKVGGWKDILVPEDHEKLNMVFYYDLKKWGYKL